MTNKSLTLRVRRKKKNRLATGPIRNVEKRVSTPTAQHSMAFLNQGMNAGLWNEPWDGGCRRDARALFCKNQPPHIVLLAGERS